MEVIMVNGQKEVGGQKGIPVYKNSAAHSNLYACFPEYTYPASYLERHAPQVLEDLEGKVIADVGCGFGSAVIALMKEKIGVKAKFVHIDSDPRVFDITKACKILGEMISKLYDRSKDRQIVADIVNLPLEDSTVDILNNHYLFADNREYEGGPSKKRAVEEINRVLRPGGYILQGGSGPFES